MKGPRPHRGDRDLFWSIAAMLAAILAGMAAAIAGMAWTAAQFAIVWNWWFGG